MPRGIRWAPSHDNTSRSGRAIGADIAYYDGRMERNPEELTCISIIVCDDVYRDEQTKKLVIVGTFNTIFAQSFPCRHQQFRVLFTLTNGSGPYNLSLSIENARTGNVLMELKGPATLDNPLQIADVDVGIENMVFPEPGRYWITLRSDERIVTQRPFIVSERQ